MKIKITLIAFIFSFLLFGCNVTREISKTERAEVSQVQKDSTAESKKKTVLNQMRSIKYLSIPDSSSITALLECNEKGQALIKEITELKTGTQVKTKIKLVDNVIYLDCKVDSFKVYQLYKSRIESKTDSNTSTQEKKKESQESTKKDQEFTISIGPQLKDFFIPGIMVLIALFLIRWARKNKYL